MPLLLLNRLQSLAAHSRSRYSYRAVRKLNREVICITKARQSRFLVSHQPLLDFEERGQSLFIIDYVEVI